MTDDDLGQRVLNGVSALDAEARRRAVASGNTFPALRDGLQVAGSRKRLLPGLAALWAAGHWTGRPGLARVARQGLLAILLGTATTRIAKRVACRSRPNQGADPDGWGGVDGARASFPSGHATTVSALATAVGLNRGLSPITLAGIGFAGAVGWSSMATERHWASDLMAGSVTGAAAGMAAEVIDGWLERRSEERTGRPLTPPGRPARGADAP